MSSARQITIVGMYNQVPSPPPGGKYLLDAYPASRAYSVRRLISQCNHALMAANIDGVLRQIYAVDFPKHPPKKRRILKKWRNRYASEDCQLELIRLTQQKIVNRNREFQRMEAGVVVDQYLEHKFWEHRN